MGIWGASRLWLVDLNTIEMIPTTINLADMKVLDECLSKHGKKPFYSLARQIGNNVCECEFMMGLDHVADTFELMNIVEMFAECIEQYWMGETTRGVFVADLHIFKNDIIKQVHMDILN